MLASIKWGCSHGILDTVHDVCVFSVPMQDLIHGAPIGKPVATRAKVTAVYGEEDGSETHFTRTLVDWQSTRVPHDLATLRSSGSLVPSLSAPQIFIACSMKNRGEKAGYEANLQELDDKGNID